jgi:hypothetical protein
MSLIKQSFTQEKTATNGRCNNITADATNQTPAK